VAATGVYRQAVRGEQGIGNQVGTLVVLTNLVFALNELGRRREALAVCRQAVQGAASQSGRALPVSDGIYLAWSLLSYEANELALAREQVTGVLDLVERANLADGVIWSQFILARVCLAQGDLAEVRRIARDVRQFVDRLDVYESKRQWLAAVEALVSIREGDLAAADRWARSASLCPTDTPHLWDEFQYFVLARILLAQGRLEEAQQLLATMERSASQGRRGRKLLTVHLLLAAMHQAAGDTQEAIGRIEKAVALAAPEDYVRAFLNEGPAILELLPEVRHLAPDFVSRVLEAAPAHGPDFPHSQALVEPLSERELEILRLIATGRSNPEIAEALYLSLNTVKWHAKNLYGKLNVSSRIEAVARAQQLKLL
jgi:LuxR family maltose regulon positive regulatory protein